MRHLDSKVLQVISFRKIDRADLRKVMVFGCKPKYRNGARLLRYDSSAQSLEQAEYRPAEQPHLLPCDYGRRTLSQPGDVFEGLLPSTEISVLALKNACDRCSPVLRIFDSSQFFPPPGLDLWWPGKKRPHLIEAVEEVFKQAGGMGDRRERQTLGIHSLGLRHWHKYIGRSPLLLVSQNLDARVRQSHSTEFNVRKSSHL